MTLLAATAAEWAKVRSLPSTAVALGISLVVTPGLAALNASALRSAVASGDTSMFVDTSPIEAAFALVPTIGLLGPIILGVVIVSSEYTPNSDGAGGGRQIMTTLISVPHRLVLLAAKALVLTSSSAAIAAVSIPTTIALSQAILGEHGLPLGEALAVLGWRVVGAGAYWMLTALIAFAVTVLTRSGVIPLIVLIANSSLVSISMLVSRVTGWGKYLPDVAGAQMFAVDFPVRDVLDPTAGAVVMAAWTVGLLAVAGTTLARRDA